MALGQQGQRSVSDQRLTDGRSGQYCVRPCYSIFQWISLLSVEDLPCGDLLSDWALLRGSALPWPPRAADTRCYVLRCFHGRREQPTRAATWFGASMAAASSRRALPCVRRSRRIRPEQCLRIRGLVALFAVRSLRWITIGLRSGLCSGKRSAKGSEDAFS